MKPGTAEAALRVCMIGLPATCAVFGGSIILDHLADLGRPEWQQALVSITAGAVIGGVMGFLLVIVKKYMVRG
ncbi:hypothetical protein WI697_27385 [Tistrella mobilis]|uniref:hypothetical protein n=1 Tax=Tistrella mobilis TaxID=171437 RepID=UPI0031F614D1